MLAWERWAWRTLEPYFDRLEPAGIGILCGRKSKGLEVLDFDDPGAWLRWQAVVDSALLATLPIVETPSGGRHVYYRTSTCCRLCVLAADEKGHPLVELKADGGMVTSVGSPLSVHESGKPYDLLQGNPLRIPVISTDQRQQFIDAAGLQNRYQSPPQARRAIKKRSSSARPGDWFNQNADWRQILEDAGWTLKTTRGSEDYWTKPNGNSKQIHATTGYKGLDILRVFTTDAAPFTAGESYNKFAAYTMLHHGGDFSKAARRIRDTHSLED